MSEKHSCMECDHGVPVGYEILTPPVARCGATAVTALAGTRAMLAERKRRAE